MSEGHKYTAYREAGKVLKTVGLEGGLLVFFSEDLNLSPLELDHVFFEKPGQLCPEFIEQIKHDGKDNYRLFLEDYDSVEASHDLIGAKLFLEKDLVSDRKVSADGLSGYLLVDQNELEVGTIAEVLLRGAVCWLQVHRPDLEQNEKDLFLVPFHEELIIDISPENKRLKLEIAEGLMSI